MKKACYLVCFLFFVAIVIGCRRTPSYVIPPDKMAEVMADIHIGESVVESNYAKYQSDSLKMLLKQSILAKHGYTLKDLDTSFMWYGYDLDTYKDIYDRTIEILEKRLEDDGVVEIKKKTHTVAGDSVDIWDKSRFLISKETSPSTLLTFSYKHQPEWTKGDVYTLRAKFINVTGQPAWTLSADYPDGSFEVLSSRFSGDGWHEISFITDSVTIPLRVYGNINLEKRSVPLLVDSIQFIRKNFDPDKYPEKIRQRKYDFNSFKIPTRNDTVVEPLRND